MARLTPEIRRKVIIDAAAKLSIAQQNVHNWTRQDVADNCVIETSVETVKHYFPAIDDLRREVTKRPDTASCVNYLSEK